jgi:hypothetical protein
MLSPIAELHTTAPSPTSSNPAGRLISTLALRSDSEYTRDEPSDPGAPASWVAASSEELLVELAITRCGEVRSTLRLGCSGSLSRLLLLASQQHVERFGFRRRNTASFP